MPSLLDAINSNTQAAGAQKQGLTDQTQGIGTLLRAKSGKAGVSGGDVGASNLGEQQAVTQTNNTMQNQVAPAAQTQAATEQAAATGQEQQAEAEKANISQARKFDTLQTNLRVNQTLQDLEQNKGKVDQQRRDAQVNQVAQNLRLQTQQYTDTLQREGERARLNDQLQFKEALAETNFGDMENLLKDSLGNKSVLDASDREYQKALADMTIQNAYDVFKFDQKQAQQRAVMGGAGNLLSTGAGAAASGSSSLDNSSALSTKGSSASDYTSLNDYGTGGNASDYTSLPD